MDASNQGNANSLIGILKSKKTIFTLLSVVIIAVISLVYFYPDSISGNMLRQSDVMQGLAVGHEASEYYEQTGEVTRWTNSLFSGMPTFQISPTYQSSKLVSWVNTVYGLGLPSPSNLLFMMMIGFFILMLACRVRWYVALLGAIAYAFSTYFMILIGAGHIWKYVTLAYIPPTIAGIIWCYRGKYLWGGALAAFFAMMQIASNHVQMTYYFMFVVLFIVLAYLEEAIRKGTFKKWGIATAVLAVAAILAVGANSPSLYNTYKYSKETMRGGHSEIVKDGENADSNATNGGLDKDYITAWSYGKAETWTLLIPNFKGGATIKPEKGNNNFLSLAQTEKATEMLNKGEIDGQTYQVLSQFPQYFGDQPMTNGPVYVGALILVLFLIGCVIVKGRLKWALLAATLLTVMLSWGHNFMWFTDLFIDYFPMYNKFRTVSSILVVAEFTIPLLAMLALNKIITEPDVLKKRAGVIFGAFGFAGLICLIVYMFPGMVNVYSASETEQFVNTGVTQQYPELFAAVTAVRESMISADAIRSFIVILLGAGVLFMVYLNKVKPGIAAALLIIVTLFDLVSVNKRYLNTDSFMAKSNSDNATFVARPVDMAIKADTAMNYRVFDQQRFSEAMPSYFHKTVGGYHAAKLTRYQDLIDNQLSKGNMQVLNMLNTKYFIANDETANINPDALGNAWFVDTLVYVNTPNEEMSYLDNFNAATQAVADAKFKGTLGEAVLTAPGDTIFETTYAPNALTYHANSQNGGIAVFSEIYFPWGWKATIDGNDAEIGRVNYVLRALKVPAGNHTIKFVFDPDSVKTTETIAYISIILIYLAIVAAIALFAVKTVRGKE